VSDLKELGKVRVLLGGAALQVLALTESGIEARL